MTPSDMTGDQADARSIVRAHANFVRLATLALIVFILLLIFGATLQRQQLQLKAQFKTHAAYTMRMCEQRRDNIIKANENWAEMERIETHNKFIDASLRDERIALYRKAKLEVPECTM